MLSLKEGCTCLLYPFFQNQLCLDLKKGHNRYLLMPFIKKIFVSGVEKMALMPFIRKIFVFDNFQL